MWGAAAAVGAAAVAFAKIADVAQWGLKRVINIAPWTPWVLAPAGFFAIAWLTRRRQTRMAQIAEHRSHLDLQINLLTEQKATKTLEMVDAMLRELKDMRGVPAEAASEHEEEMEEMTKPADPHAILDAIKQKQP